ncbi:MAG TPA: lysophospholipid acyltransferase family protein [Steroidobacteraceae bacterium]|nr:lysophospholipid acyltransferase family protein [Steroidobacteraceae bacterium]
MSEPASGPAGMRRRRPAVLQAAGSLFFTAFLFLWTFFYAIPFVLACLVLPFPRRFPLARFWAATLLSVLRWSCGLDYRVEGEPIPAGAHIAFWKHSSSWETMAMMVVFPRQVWVLKRELLWIPVVGIAVRQMHAIAIDRRAGHSAVSQVIAQGKDRLAEGDWVMIFPEGTRMPAGETRRYGVSGTLLAAETGAFIVPVAHDAGHYWPRRGLMKKPGTVRVVIGPAVAAAGREARAVNEELQRWVEATVRRLTSNDASL